MLRVRLSPTGTWSEEESFVVDRLPDARTPVELDAAEGCVRMCCGGPEVELRLQPFSFCVRGQGGRTVVAAPAGSLESRGDRSIQRLELAPGERIYGLGQGTYPHLDLRNQERRMWHEWRGGRHSGPVGIPFMLSTRGYGLLLNSSWPARFVIGLGELAPAPALERAARVAPAPWPLHEHSGESDPNRIAILLDNPQMDYFLLLGATPEDILRECAVLTGRPPMPPLWALGYVQSKNRYRSQEELLEVARGFRGRGIPGDALVIDWLWFKTFGDMQWDDRAWPDPRALASELRSMGFTLMQAQHPFVDRGAVTWDEFKAKGYLVELPEQADELIPHQAVYDHTNPRARADWWEKVRPLFDDGIRGYWTDMGEPECHPVGSRHHLGGRERVHNIYAVLWAKGLYDGQRSYTSERVFSLSRAGYAGLPRYGAAMWSGDIDHSWEVLRDQVIIGQQVCMSGLPYWTTDIGGYMPSDFHDAELYVRWLQWGTFCPVFRTHGERPGNEPWSFGPQAEEIVTEFIRLRYRLLPYIYAGARVTHETGLPMMKAMALTFPDDDGAAEREMQFMFGASLLVAPVVEQGARSRQVYLPRGEWYDFWTERRHAGPAVVNAFAPLARIPVYVRAGSIVPMAEETLHTGEKPLDPLVIHVYPGSDANCELYEDDGTTYGYEEGRYAKTDIVYREEAGAMVVGPVAGAYPGQPSVRSYRVMLHDQDPPASVWLNDAAVERAAAGGRGPGEMAGKPWQGGEPSWSYDEATRVLEVLTPHLPVVGTLFIQVKARCGMGEAVGAGAPAAVTAGAAAAPMCAEATARERALGVWADASWPEEGAAVVCAYACLDGGAGAAPAVVEWELMCPPGWSAVSGPAIRKDISGGITAASWVLEASGPEFTALGEAKVRAAAGGEGREAVVALASGFDTHWQVVGPFPNDGGLGFDAAYGPEERVDLAASYAASDGRPTSWRRYDGLDSLGYVDFMRVISAERGLGAEVTLREATGVAYAAGSVWSPAGRSAVLELLGEDRFKVWLDGRLVLLASDPPASRLVRARMHLHEGYNNVLLKCTQDGTKEWGGRRWGFYLRILDEYGSPMKDLVFRSDWV